jgi:hypothetical protein
VFHHVGCDVRASPAQACLAVHCYRSLLILAQLQKRLEGRKREKDTRREEMMGGEDERRGEWKELRKDEFLGEKIGKYRVGKDVREDNIKRGKINQYE